MSDRDNYPAGAYNDPRAPYNQPDEHEFDDQINEKIDTEIEDLDAWFTEWIGEKILKIECDGNELEDIATHLAESTMIRELYHDYRYEDARDAFFSDERNFEAPEPDYEDE